MKKANKEIEIFQAKRALNIPKIDCRMFLLNIQAVKAIRIQIAQANSLVDKLSKILFIYKV